MITELYYWIFLAGGVVTTFIISERFRFQLFSLYSIAFLLFSLASLPERPLVEPQGSWLEVFFSSNYRVVVDLLVFSLASFYLPFFCRRKALPVTRFLLIVILFAYLTYHKYLPVMLQYVAGKSVSDDILLPLGISYFTFKLIHYLVERGRGNFAVHSFCQFLAYIFLFPIYTAGPIERFDHFLSHCSSRAKREDLIDGGTRIIYGLIKKFLIVGILLSGLMNHNDAGTILIRVDSIAQYKVWGFLLLTYLMIYLDFSAYSDIAIGSSRLLGFRIMENFNWPILASNISLLWRRWHMTLSGWCQSYVYMPTIGITRNPYAAIILTFLAVGLWHGGALSWVFWGLYQGLGVSGYVVWSQWKKKRKMKLTGGFAGKILCVGLTNFWMAGSFAFTTTYTDGSWSNVVDAFVLLRRYFLIF